MHDIMIIPVLDLKNGIAVFGKSGIRETYKPLKTVFNQTSEPYKIAKSLKESGATYIYVADLDAIEEIGSNFDIISKINNKIPVILDSGANNVKKVNNALMISKKVIVATETLEKMEDLHQIFNHINNERIIVSVDIKNNIIYSNILNIDFNDIIREINRLKPKEIIILDLSKVGTEKGVNLGLIKRFKNLKTSIIVGGGITRKDIVNLQNLGINKFLVGSALHQGKLLLNF
jgi:phosphoribosylformimino-5-aminoimidazole carboxamide ribotide isomerase